MKKVIFSTMMAMAMAGSANADVLTDNPTIVNSVVAVSFAALANTMLNSNPNLEQDAVPPPVLACDSGDVKDGEICVNTEVTTTVIVSGTGTVAVPLTVISTYPAYYVAG